MKVYLCDHKFKPQDTAESKWFGALASAFPSQFVSPLKPGRHAPPEKHEAFEDPTAVLFVHSADQGGWLNVAKDAHCQIVLVRSIGGQTENCEALTNLHCCYWRPEDFLGELPPQVDRFISMVKADSIDKINWTLLQPDFDSLFVSKFYVEAGGSPPSSPSSVAEALRRFFPENGNLVILDYGNPKTVENLWTEGLQSLKPRLSTGDVDYKSSATVLLIVGEDPPGEFYKPKIACLGGINFRGNLSAASWAAAWRLRFPKAKARVVLLSSSPYESGSPVPRALGTLFRATDMANFPLVPGVKQLRSPSLALLQEAVRGEADRTGGNPRPIEDMLRSVLWNGLTSEREAHHAVSNVAGALQMNPAQSGESSPLAHLLTLIELCRDGKRIPLEFPWRSDELHGEIGSAVLIDDMAEFWTPFLAAALGFEPSKSSEDFNVMIGGLPGRLSQFLDNTNLRYLSIGNLIGNDTEEKEFVLFLDLRLFSSLGGGSVEREFHEGLALFGEKLLGTSGRNLPWVPKGGAERARLEDDLKDMKEGVIRPGVSETVLPRLISLLDPTLPIIVFSSTHRTELIEPFRAYGNIITGFRKPVLSGMTSGWQEVVKNMKSDFGIALERSVKVLRARRVMREFGRRKLKQPASGAQSSEFKLPKSDHGYLVEVFFDESLLGREAVCVGGVVVVRELNRDGVAVVSDAAIFNSLDPDSRDGNIGLWGWSKSGPREIAPEPQFILPKGEDFDFEARESDFETLRRGVGAVKDVLGLNGGFFPFAAIKRTSTDQLDWMKLPPGGRPRDVEEHLDATLRELLLFLLEGLIFRSDIIRLALSVSKSQLAVDLGIREYPCGNTVPWIHENFGFELDRNGWRSSIREDDGFKILSEAIAKALPLSAPSLRGKVVRARAVRLQDFKKYPIPKSGPRPEQLHYLADWVSNIFLCKPDVMRRPGISDFFKSGWMVDLRDAQNSEELRHPALWRACIQGNAVEGIVSAASLKNASQPNGIGIDFYDHLRRTSRALSGEEFVRCFDRLPRPAAVDASC